MNGGSGVYIPEAFREERPEVLRAFIERHPLGAMICTTADGFVANHIPMMLTGGGDSNLVLRGHMARANPVWKSVAPDSPVLVIFGGANHYISPSWYPAKQEHGRVVPTWNYAAVHAHGALRVHEDREWLRGLVTKLTETHEAQFERPWSVTDAPADYIDGLLKAIVGIEIPIERLEGKWKMGQNRTDADREAAAEKLQQMKAASAAETGELMARVKERG